MFTIARIIFLLFIVVGFWLSTREGKIKAFALYIILVFVMAAVLLSVSCDEVIWLGKIPICK